MLEIKDVQIIFSPNTPLEQQVLKDFNLKIQPGQFVCLLGSNGAGKSTLMKLISGEIAANDGDIYLGKKNLTRVSAEKRAKNFSRVSQDPAMGTFGYLTVEENLSVALKRGKERGLKFALSSQRRKMFKERLKSLGVGLEHRLSTKMSALSGGQRQAIALLMASLEHSDLLLLDEHTAALDPKMSDRMMELTNELVQNQQQTTLMITHNLQHALKYGNRLIILQQGQVVADYSEEEKSRLTIEDLKAQL